MPRNNLKNKRKIGRWIIGKLVKLKGKFDHELYMKLYLIYLKKLGMDIEGKPIYISTTTSFDGKDYSKIHIGDSSVISSEVRFLTHDYSISRGIEATGLKLIKEVYFVKDIYIGKNCFIGTRTILMPGVFIGDNVIVGAGSVVRGKIPDNSIIIGNPAVIIGNTIDWANKKIKNSSYYENK
jgi:acetyltransferase-like isoleucine patch superfamily enzyme